MDYSESMSEKELEHMTGHNGITLVELTNMRGRRGCTRVRDTEDMAASERDSWSVLVKKAITEWIWPIASMRRDVAPVQAGLT